MRIKIHHIPASAAFLLGLFVGVAIMNLVVGALTPKSFQEEYGQSLAKLTAQRAVEATFHQNLVQLHAILEELLSYPQVQLATIHDVENQLLVQAGEGHKHTSDTQNSFTAPVILHDSIAGYVTITIPPHPSNAKSLKVLLYILDVLLLAAAISLLWSEKSFTIEGISRTNISASQPRADTDAHNTQSSDDDNEEQGTNTQASPVPMVFTVIQIKNAEVLKQQLSGEVYRTTRQRVADITQEVLALYNGAGFEYSDEQLILSFYAGDAINEALFRATCSAFLIVELASIINNIPLNLAAYISADKESLYSAENLPVAGLVLESEAANDEVIQRRLRFMEMGGGDNRQVVSGFAAPFEALLENQHKQLSQII